MLTFALQTANFDVVSIQAPLPIMNCIMLNSLGLMYTGLAI